MSKEAWTTYNMCDFYYQFTTKRFEKQACLVGTARLDLDASFNENGPSLSSNPVHVY
jgi:hypothetical protein